MGVTININNLTLCHKGSDGVAIATLPDVCKTPPGPVPVPYPNVAFSKHLKKGTKTIKVDGGKMAANKGSEFSQSIGDEPGVAGGVKSSTNLKEATWLTYSLDVKLEGKNACRLTDKMLMNHQNTLCAGGELQKSIQVTSPKDTQDCPVNSITFKRNNIHLTGEDKYGHWWFEIDNSESYGWWPKDPVGPIDTLLGTDGELNGQTSFGGTATMDPHHGDQGEEEFHPVVDCSDPRSEEEIKECLRHFARGYNGEWRWTFGFGQNCHTFQEAAMEHCGLRKP